MLSAAPQLKIVAAPRPRYLLEKQASNYMKGGRVWSDSERSKHDSQNQILLSCFFDRRRPLPL